LKQFTRRSTAVVTGVILSLGCLAPMASAAQSPTAAGVAVPSVAGNPDVADLVPSDWRARRRTVERQMDVEDSPVEEALERAIDPDDYECAPTDLDAYVDGLLAGLTDEELEFLLTSGVLDFPTYDALLFGSKRDPRYRLTGHARQLKSTFRHVKRFWDIKSDDIQLHAMHGDMLLDTRRVARLLVVLYGLTEDEASMFAAAVADIISGTPAFDDGDNPIFTLNAYAFTAEGDPDPLVASVPDKLVFGDGILDALDALRLGNVGPRVVMGHEFGHHIQFEQNLFESDLDAPEATRRTELMADAFATYFGVHKRGLALEARGTRAAVKTFYEVGDCSFDNPGHHGTPNQRARAAKWGAHVARTTRPQWRILPSPVFAARFEARLAELVAPDADGLVARKGA